MCETDLTADEAQKRIDKLIEVVEVDEAFAQSLLQDHDWNVEAALEAHLTVAAASTQPPDNFTLLSWNIDGLDDKNFDRRCKYVADTIEQTKADVVLLQEVILRSLDSLKNHLPHYQVLTPNDHTSREYFTVILLRCTTVYLDEQFDFAPFPGSVMGRGLHYVTVHVGDAHLTLMTTHLESTKDFAEERTSQLVKCLKSLKKQEKRRNVLLGGDLNLRDAELASVGGLPEGVLDLWEANGARKECRYTWDMSRNTNLQLPGKAKCRFDRVYFRPPDRGCKALRPVHFGLVGLDKVPGTQYFASDHWGVLCGFKIE